MILFLSLGAFRYEYNFVEIKQETEPKEEESKPSKPVHNFFGKVICIVDVYVILHIKF